jgi:hypothetical protein
MLKLDLLFFYSSACGVITWLFYSLPKFHSVFWKGKPGRFEQLPVTFFSTLGKKLRELPGLPYFQRLILFC